MNPPAQVFRVEVAKAGIRLIDTRNICVNHHQQKRDSTEAVLARYSSVSVTVQERPFYLSFGPSGVQVSESCKHIVPQHPGSMASLAMEGEVHDAVTQTWLISGRISIHKPTCAYCQIRSGR